MLDRIPRAAAVALLLLGACSDSPTAPRPDVLRGVFTQHWGYTSTFVLCGTQLGMTVDTRSTTTAGGAFRQLIDARLASQDSTWRHGERWDWYAEVRGGVTSEIDGFQGRPSYPNHPHYLTVTELVRHSRTIPKECAGAAAVPLAR